MHITVGVADLSAAVAAAFAATPKRGATSALSNILLQTMVGGLEVIGTDGDFSVMASLPAQIKQTGMICLPARNFNDYLSALPDEANLELKGEVTGEANSDNLPIGKASIRCGRSTHSLPVMPSADFPAFAMRHDERAQLSTPDFAQGIKSTLFSASKIRGHAFSSVLLQAQDKTLNFLSRDGHRMSRYQCDLLEPTRQHREAIVPRDEARDILAILPEMGLIDLSFELDEENTVRRLCVAASDHEGPSVAAICPVLSGTLPDVTKYFSYPMQLTCVFNRMALTSALRRIELVAESNDGYSAWEIKDGVASIRTETVMGTQAREEVECSITKGTCHRFGVNAHYILQAIRELGGEEIEMHLSEEKGPILLKGERGAFTHFTAPMALR